jgi:nitrate/nitrite-specific signal transduction histidine kinase
MSKGDGMAEVTEADREKAMQIMAWDPLSYEGFAQAVDEGNDPDDRDSLETVDAIAAALAEEREKARAPFLALVQELATVATYHHATVAGDAYADSADRIMAILEGTYR